MEQVSRDFFFRLLDTISPSGYEGPAARVYAAEAESFCDQVTVDVHGNVHAVVNPGGSPRILLAGHLDEIGLQITHIDDDGFVRFAPIGGWDPQIPQGQRVWIQSARGRVLGLVGKKPIHLLKDEARKKVFDLDQQWIDVGAKSRAEAEAMVAIGDPAVLAWGVEELPNGLVVGRGLDDRCGAFVVLEAARLAQRLAPSAAIHAVATVQEEIGLRGAITSAYSIHPQAAIAVDVTHATDYPEMKESRGREGHIRLGAGPVIARGPNINPPLFDHLVSTARRLDLTVQVAGEPRGTGTDANAIQLSRGGVATAVIAVPNRYMHSPVELVSWADLEGCYTLTAHAVAGVTDATEFRPW